MRKPTLSQRLRYAFDNTMSRGTVAIIGWLGLASLLLIAVFSAVVLIGGFRDDRDVGVIRQLYDSLLHAMDPGTIGGDDGRWYFLLTMLLVTFGGIFLVSILIGVLTTGIEGRLEQLRKGRSLVLEQDHTLILGWSDHVFLILRELAQANASRRKSAVVVLADRDRVEMEDLIRQRVGDTGSMRVVCRRGDPIDLADLQIGSPQTARSIIVLSPEGDEPDAQVIKTVLALSHLRDGRRRPFHVVAEIRDPRNLEAARLVGGDEALFVDVDDTISRLIVQTSRQPGLPLVYTELLDFEGHEIYIHEDPALRGGTFADALLARDHTTALGVLRADGTLRLNPPDDLEIGAGDALVVLAEDDSVLNGGGPSGAVPAPDEAAIVTSPDPPDAPERMIVLGWNDRARGIVRKLDGYVADGSEVLVVASVSEAEAGVHRLRDELANLRVAFRFGETTDRATLDALGIEDFDHVIVLCYEDHLDAQRADARTLVTLLHLRDIERIHGERFSVVSEMLDERNRQLAEVTEVDDFIVSDQLIALLLSQVSENRHLMKVFGDIFDSGGNEIYLKPAEQYVRPGVETTFATVVAAARRRGHLALGYRRAADGGEVRVNPRKSTRLTAEPGDAVVVLAER